MAKGFFRELKHYKLNDISMELNIEAEEAKRLVGVLKKYGIVKAVKASKPEYADLYIFHIGNILPTNVKKQPSD